MRTAVAVAALLVVVLMGAARAHLGEIVYPIYELPTSDLPDLHDGTLEDWEEVLPNASLNHNDFIRDNSGITGTVDPEDLAFRVFLAWHSASQRIYMGVERIDDVYLDPSVGCCGEGSTQLMIDGDHSGGKFWFLELEGYSREESMRLHESQAQTFSVRPEGAGDRLLYSSPAALWTVDSPWADAGGFQQGEGPNYSAVEFAVTAWDHLLSDSDVANRSAGSYVLALSTVRYWSEDRTWAHDGFADNFVDGELIPCHRGDCGSAAPGASAVRMDSWGRIKASFR